MQFAMVVSRSGFGQCARGRAGVRIGEQRARRGER
jgi:hypothetical protein